MTSVIWKLDEDGGFVQDPIEDADGETKDSDDLDEDDNAEDDTSDDKAETEENQDNFQ